jgi:hypothetical protein
MNRAPTREIGRRVCGNVPGDDERWLVERKAKRGHDVSCPYGGAREEKERASEKKEGTMPSQLRPRNRAPTGGIGRLRGFGVFLGDGREF